MSEAGAGDAADFARRGEDTARKMLSDAGFASIEAVHIDDDIVNAYIIATKG